MSARSYLAFDFGLTRIGVAGGEDVTASARALITLPAQQGAPDWHAVSRLIAEWQPAALIVGIPQHDDCHAPTIAPAAQRFRRRLAGRFTLPVHAVNEALSSHEAADRLTRSGKGVTKAADKARLDAAAAAVILETWFSEQSLR